MKKYGFGLMWLLICLSCDTLLLWGEGVILDQKVIERLKSSVQFELLIGPREPSEENSYREKVDGGHLLVHEDSDEKKFILLFKHLDLGKLSAQHFSTIDWLKKVKLEVIKGAHLDGEKRVNELGREFRSTHLILEGKGRLRLGEVEKLVEVGEPLALRYWLHLEEVGQEAQETSEDWHKYLSVSREEADPPFPQLATTLEMESRRQELLRSVTSMTSGQYVTAIYGLKYLGADEALKLVSDQLSPDGKMKAALARDQLIVTDRRDYVLNIIQTLEALDLQAPEVSIEVKIVELNRSAGLDLGIDWGGVKSGQYGGRLGVQPLGGASATVAGASLGSAVLQAVVSKGVDQLTMQISALLQKGMAKVMSEPKLLVANRSTGEFRMTEQIPVMVRKKISMSQSEENRFDSEFSDSSVATDKTTDTREDLTFITSSTGSGRIDNKYFDDYLRLKNEVSAQVQKSLSDKLKHYDLAKSSQSSNYEEVLLETGITLKVTPVIHQGGVIELNLSPKITEISHRPSGSDMPILAKREVQTKAYVRDGETLVLGGLIYEKEFTDRGSVPGLSRIPVLGMFFKKEKTRKETRELLFLVKTRIVQL